MDNNMSLTNLNQGFISRMIIKIKRKLSHFLVKEKSAKTLENCTNVNNIKDKNSEKRQDINDFECLKAVVEGKIKIKDLDNKLRKRLINICNERILEVNKSIERKERQIERAKELKEKISNM